MICSLRVALPPPPTLRRALPLPNYAGRLALPEPTRLALPSAQSVGFLSMTQRVLVNVDKRPLLFAMACGLFKNSICDTFTQKTLQGKERMDKRRLAAFAFFGTFYVGFMQYQFYNKLFPLLTKRIRTKSRLQRAMLGAAYDNFVILPFFYLPTFYAVKQIFAGSGGVDEAWAVYKENLTSDLPVSWMIYLPAQFLNFGFLPFNLRVPFTTLVGFFYITGLSYFRGEMH